MALGNVNLAVQKRPKPASKVLKTAVKVPETYIVLVKSEGSLYFMRVRLTAAERYFVPPPFTLRTMIFGTTYIGEWRRKHLIQR